MRVKCIHGFFIFEEIKVGQISDFCTYTGFSIVPRGDSYTFDGLELAPGYSLAGKPILGVPAIKTFEGQPWEVFAENQIVYDFSKGMVVPINTVTVATTIKQAGNRFIAPPAGMILPGSLTPSGRVTGFDAWFSRDRLNWLYTGVTFEQNT